MGLSRRGRAKSFLLVLTCLGLALTGARGTRVHAQEPIPAQRWDGLIELISGVYPWQPPTTEPPIPADGPSELSRHAISADGRFIVFTANAPSLGYSDVALYMRDRRTGDTTPILAGPALEPAISADGNHIVYKICDPWMRPDQLPICDIYALDLRNWAWALISESREGDHGDTDSSEPVISADGRFVVYKTTALNILRTPTQLPQLVLRDRDPDRNGVFDELGTPINEVITRPFNGGGVGNGESETPEVSDDGRYVAFRSTATDLVPGTLASWNVFRRDRRSHETRQLNVRPDGSPSLSPIVSPAISMSANGQVVAFTSSDPYLTWGYPDDSQGWSDVFVFDELGDPLLKRIDIGEGSPVAQGYLPGNGPSAWPSISADGRYVAFMSEATNVTPPAPPPGTSQVYVYDRATGTPTRITVKPDGTEFDGGATHPQISRDGSLVAFLSTALNLSPNVQTPIDRVYAAVHFEVTPAEVEVPGSGGQATFTITTQQHTQWWVDWTNWTDWIWFESPPMGVGSASLSVRVPEANKEPVRRTAPIKIHTKEVKLTQLEGLSLTSVSPSAGPAAGGTAVTIRGTGFEPGINVDFGGYPATAIEIVDSTTLIATTPAHENGLFWVGVFSADYNQFAWLDEAFRFLDGTPPQIYWYVDGTVGGDGWYTSNATVNWWPWDEETEVTSASGCDPTTVTADTPGTTFTCTATSDGGTSSGSVTVKRDATPPVVTVVTPTASIYELNSVVIPQVTCTDAMSGVAQCGEVPSPSPLNTAWTGWQSYGAFAVDVAGNYGYGMQEYAVSSGACTAATAGLKLWFPFEGTTRDVVHGSPYGSPWPGPIMPYTQGMVGQAVQLTEGTHFRFTHALADVTFTDRLTFAAWVNPEGEAGEAGVIASKEDQFRIARFADGTVRFAFNNADPGYVWVNTGAVLPLNTWSHLALTYDNGVVKTYINGRLVHTHQGSGVIQSLAGLPSSWGSWLTLGNRHDPAHKSAFIGALDEVQFLNTTWEPSEVDALFFAGAQGMCKLTSTVTLAAISTASFGSSTFVARAQLRDAASQQGIAGKTIRFESFVSQGNVFVGAVNAVTDADGWAIANLPIGGTAGVSTYSTGFRTYFNGDVQYGGSFGIGEMTLQKATPVITWPTPAAIPYGTPISGTQLNATANTAGYFFYSQTAGAVLAPDTYTLSVKFQPVSSNYATATASVVLEVVRATPVLSWNTPAPIVYGAALGAAQLNATANVGGTWSYSPAAGTVPNAGAAQTLTATFTPADPSKYEGGSVSTTIDVAKATPTVTVSSAAYTYDGAAHPASATVTGINGAELGPVSFTYNDSPDAPVNAGSYAVVATFAGDTNYNAASATCTVTIGKAAPSLTWNQPQSIVYGTALSPSALAAASSVPGTFNYTPDAGTRLNAGNGQTLTATFVPTDAANYNSGSVTTTIDVAKATPAVIAAGGSYVYDGEAHPASGAATGVLGEALSAVTFTYNGSSSAPVNAGHYDVVAAFAGSANYVSASATATIDIGKAASSVSVTGGSFTYDGAPHAATASAAGNGGAALNPVTVTYNGSSDVPVNAGTYLVSAAFAGNSNYEAASNTATLTIGKASPAVSWPSPSALVYGTPLGGAQLNASSTVTGTFTYSPSAGAVLAAGNGHPLAATFTPSDSINYTGAAVSTTVDVAKAPLVVAAQDAQKVFGAPLPALAASASGFVNGDSFASLGGAIAFATTATQQSAVGAYPIVPSGVSSANYAITFVTGTLSVVRGGTAVALSASPQPSGANEPMTFTATVSVVSPAVGQPGGIVQFFDGATLLGSAVLTAGQATLTTAGLDSGSRTIEARYAGDASFNGSTQSAAHFIQDAAGTPVVSLSSSRNPSNVGQTVTLTANVSLGGGSVGGTVEFYDGATLLGSAAIAAGRATWTSGALSAGSHAVTARYVAAVGVTDVPSSQSGVFVQAVGEPGWKDRATSMSLTSSNPSAIDAPVVFTADVTGSSSSAPTGRILFMVDGQVVGDPAGVTVATLSGTTARATVTVTGLKHGRHKVTATYLGDPTYKGSTAAVTQTVN